MDQAALKVLKAAEDTKQLLQQKEEVLAEIRGEFEQKSKEVGMLHCDSQIAAQCCLPCLTCDHQNHRTEPRTKADERVAVRSVTAVGHSRRLSHIWCI